VKEESIMKILGLSVILLLSCMADEAIAQGRMLATCRPVSERTGPAGCWIIAQEALELLPTDPVFWQLSSYPSRAAAEADKVPGATVMEALDKTWLFTIAPAGARTPGGTRVAEIGPLVLKPGTKYTAQYMEAIFPPGARTRPHTHPGPEAWYHEAGGVCLETPAGRAFGRTGDGGFIVPADGPMELTVVGKEERRSLVLILHESSKPASSFDVGWVPKGLCNE
jgi:quercetin dioxygenase-like cupin family protein